MRSQRMAARSRCRLYPRARLDSGTRATDWLGCPISTAGPRVGASAMFVGDMGFRVDVVYRSDKVSVFSDD